MFCGFLTDQKQPSSRSAGHSELTSDEQVDLWPCAGGALLQLRWQRRICNAVHQQVCLREVKSAADEFTLFADVCKQVC